MVLRYSPGLCGVKVLTRTMCVTTGKPFVQYVCACVMHKVRIKQSMHNPYLLVLKLAYFMGRDSLCSIGHN